MDELKEDLGTGALAKTIVGLVEGIVEKKLAAWDGKIDNYNNITINTPAFIGDKDEARKIALWIKDYLTDNDIKL